MNDNSSSFIRPDQFWHDLGLAAGQNVVHLGCGAGFYLIPAAKIVGMSGKAVGVDVLVHYLEEVDNRAHREKLASVVQTIRGNIENPSGSTLPKGSMDWVLAANILHQSDPSKVLAEARRVVSDSGRVVTVGWDTAASPLGPPTASRISKPQIIDMAKENGLQLDKEFSPSPYHYGLVFTAS
jgi:ubiquinone/menaquinone biosynthesis C-methylase UbiE